ncbi:tRNA uridine(34) 5-carboxymethylaminomethyl modification radical SAM/GNAT enzyme Elp3 [Candidatus Bathyarchaeota archaeon]|nr:tRNA uridine(34) 5-carboxymethylaminomethyl modification radical SAM/GNAT enzyme Elp3 [Candidatus Bathyarchaeota archaeon]
MSKNEAIREIINKLLNTPLSDTINLTKLKTQTAAKYKLQTIPPNSHIINALKPAEKPRLLPLLQRKKTRTISGVTVIAVMTKPYPCPQPEPCAYCPGGPKTNTPQSYTGHEPAAMRGKQNNYNPYKQVKNRILQLQAIGHKVDKIELIIMGGTFPATPTTYQERFIQRCLDAITKKKSKDLEEAKKHAETSKIRNVGITVETRPDWAKEPHIDQMLNMGVTRVELGVQNPNNQIYKLVGRTHSVQDVTEATRIMKDAGIKITYHMMPGMPSTTPKKDLDAFKKVFTDTRFKPDMIKIYPCLVLEDTKLHGWYKKGNYTPYSEKEAEDLIMKIKRIVPPWVRIMRVQRDIPSRLITAGVTKSDLRERVRHRMKEKKQQCRCIRCREVGHRMLIENIRPDPENVKILKRKYKASEGEEIFISAEDQQKDVLIGYLRLRIPSAKAHRPEIKQTPCSIVRELHVYGPLVPVGKHLTKAWQHKGYGSLLLAEAEHVTEEDYDLKRILVISALGTKQYYLRFGYRHDGVYMSKMLVH